MPLRRILPSSPSYAADLDALCDRSSTADAEVERAVAAILADVRARGDAAVRELTERFDGRAPEAGTYEISEEQWEARAAAASTQVVAALERAAERIRVFHEGQKESSYTLQSSGSRLSLRVLPLSRVGIYVPGGTARYPSSVLMTAVPAKVAGVSEIVMVTPGASAETLAAARVAGVDRVFEIGGAQAVAALAYGTGTVPRVDKIVGPGNQWVATAKRQVYGDVDIDSVAGPSEVLIVADHTARASWVAADLLAQAEHDVEARPILIATHEPLIDEVDAELDRQLAELPRAEIAGASLSRYGVAALVSSVPDALALADRYAPEHLELLVEDPHSAAEGVRAAGAIFVGPYAPEAAGDYLAGPNHVLPTAGAARFASPLGVHDFRKRISIIEYARQTLAEQVDDISCLAEVEGLDAHGRSVRIRFEEDSD